MPGKFLTALFAAPLLAAGCAQAAEPVRTIDGIQIENAWARRAPATALDPSAGHGATTAHGGSGNGAVYVTITNRGGNSDAIVGAATDAAISVELHETVQEGNVMTMRPVPRFEVPAGGRLEMKPGGHHIMLMGLKRDLKPGDTVTVTVTFEKAGPMTVEATVR